MKEHLKPEEKLMNWYSEKMQEGVKDSIYGHKGMK